MAVEHEGRAFASWFNEAGHYAGRIEIQVAERPPRDSRRRISAGRYACWKSAPESYASGLWG